MFCDQFCDGINYCTFCKQFCNGTCEEWQNLTAILNSIIMDEPQKQKRRYKSKEELLSSSFLSEKCLECRVQRQVCDKQNNCERCSKSKKRQCVYDIRLNKYT